MIVPCFSSSFLEFELWPEPFGVRFARRNFRRRSSCHKFADRSFQPRPFCEFGLSSMLRHLDAFSGLLLPILRPFIFRFGLQVSISGLGFQGLISEPDSRFSILGFRFQVNVPGLDFRLRFQVYVSGLEFRFGFQG